MKKMEKKRACPERSRKVFVGMSGGVDSSVAAYLLKKDGYDVVGVFMKCWTGSAPFDKLRVNCAWERDSEDARRVAEKLDIPFYVWDFEKEYKKKVIDYMVSGYKKGITPNPDVMCNKEIKFGLFFEKAMEMGADFVATGHYVKLVPCRISRKTGRLFSPAEKSSLDSRHQKSCGCQAFDASETFFSKRGKNLAVYCLKEAKDKNKDQSYFLWTLTQKQLSRCLFPIGDYLKPEVRKIAKKAGLLTAEKKDSQGICFLGQIRIEDFLKDYIPEKKGDILLDGKKIGTHKGAHFYTIGQRHGLGVAGKNPYYISEKNVKKNIIKVVEGDKHLDLYKKEVELENVNFINQQSITNNKQQAWARVRYRQSLIRAKLVCGKKNCKLLFDKPVKFIASGQSAVFYRSYPSAGSGRRSKKGVELRMLGGGIIK